MPSDKEQISVMLSSSIAELRGKLVTPASVVADVFEVPTRQIVQNIKRNKSLFTEQYAFEVSKAELAELRSLGVIPKPGRGGSRALPWMITRKGILRLVLMMDNPKAIEAADLLVDLLDNVLVQLYSGKSKIQIEQPARFVAQEDDSVLIKRLRTKMIKAVDSLVSTVIDPATKKTVGDELSNTAKLAMLDLKEVFRTRKINNEKVEAETVLILEQARDLYERRQSELADAALDRESKALDLMLKKIEVIEKLKQSIDGLEAPQLLQPHKIMGAQSPKTLPKPKKR